MTPPTYAEKVAAITTRDELEGFKATISLFPSLFSEDDRAILREKELRMKKEGRG